MENNFNNTIVLFKNEYYKEGENKPVLKGKLVIDGVEKEIALWVKEKDGKNYYSGKISAPYVKEGSKPTDPLKRGQVSNDDDSGLPF